MSIWMELRCNVNKQNGKCLSDTNNGPMGWSRNAILKEGKEQGWRFGKNDHATCPSCQL